MYAEIYYKKRKKKGRRISAQNKKAKNVQKQHKLFAQNKKRK
jgi:hypothetical protein